MSLILGATSPKHCANRGFTINKKLFTNKKLLYILSTTFLLLLSVVVVVWLILRPTKPEFYVEGADVTDLTLASSDATSLNSTIHITLAAKNPNTHVGIYYDELRAYASYGGQRITGESELPPFYQGHEDTNLLSASLGGEGVPVYPSIGYEVGRDQRVAGKLILRLRIDGSVRWKVGSWVSGKYRIDVDCAAEIAYLPEGGGSAGGESAMRLMSGAQCSTTV